MPGSFGPLLDTAPDEVTVSRIGFHAPRRTGETRSLPRQAKGMRMRYGPTPIERTLRQRQALQPCSSEPSLTSTAARAASPLSPTSPLLALPRIGSAGGLQKSRLLRNQARISTIPKSLEAGPGLGFLGSSGGFSLGSSAREEVGSGGGGGLVARGTGMECDLQDEAWLGILNGGRRVAIPFGKLANTSLDSAHWLHKANDTDGFVRWYRDAEAEAAHRFASATEERAEASAAGIAASAATEHSGLGGPRIGGSSAVPWSERQEELSIRLKRAEPGSGLALYLQGKQDLYTHLDEEVVLQGPGALLAALKFKVGTLEDALRCLDIHGTGVLTIMEFAGAMSMFGLDVSYLCGAEESSFFRALAAEHTSSSVSPKRTAGIYMKLDALPRSRGLLNRGGTAAGRRFGTASSRERASSPSRSDGHSGGTDVAVGSSAEAGATGAAEQHRAQSKWAAVARWMATAARRSCAMSEDRFRRGWRMSTPAPASRATGGGGSAASDAGSGASGANTAAAADGGAAATSVATDSLAPSAVARARQQAAASWEPGPERRRCQASPAEVLLETAVTMREQEQDLRSLFNKAASGAIGEGSQERLLQRADLTSFFADLALVEPRRSTKMSQSVLDRRYDEVLKIQSDSTKIDQGLMFWSFKAFLNNIMPDLRLGWVGLVERTLTVSPEPAGS